MTQGLCLSMCVSYLTPFVLIELMYVLSFTEGMVYLVYMEIYWGKGELYECAWGHKRIQKNVVKSTSENYY